MNFRTCLFVGGPADGEWHKVDTDLPFWRIAVPDPAPDFSSETFPSAELIATITAYKPVSFHFGSREIFICQHIDMQLDPLGLLHHICVGYGK